jgi:hypothetical protein
MPKDDDKTVLIEDARLIFLNFAGKETQYNRAGSRNFCVVLPKEDAEQLALDGWNVRMLAVKEEGDEEVYYLPVEVSFKNRPPRVVMLTSRARTNLDEDGVEVLDYADIEKADLIVNPYEWSANGKHGIKAYLKSLFVTIAEDALERKYAINDVGE